MKNKPCAMHASVNGGCRKRAIRRVTISSVLYPGAITTHFACSFHAPWYCALSGDHVVTVEPFPTKKRRG